MPLVEFLQRVEDSGCGLAMFVSQIQEVNDLTDGGVLHNQHVLGQYLDE